MPYQGSYVWRLRQKVGSDLLLVPGVEVLVVNPNGEVLLTHRTDFDLWCLPGGTAEEGGSFLDTALDELREETGITAKPEDLVPYATVSRIDNHFIVYPNGDRVHSFGLVFAIENWTGKAKAGDEVRQIRFFDPDALPDNMFTPSLAAINLYKDYKKTGKFQVA